MSLESLSWLNAKYVEKVLKTSSNDESIRVTDLAIELATATGDNWSSDIIRARVEYFRDETGRKVTERKSLIIKVALTEEGAAKQMVLELEAFDIEMKMMTRTLKEMNELLNEEGCRLSPRVLHAKIGDPSVIVMEDLSPLGFRMVDRRKGLDLEHSLLAIERLAKFHASSVALNEKNPEAMFAYVNDDSQKKTEAVKKFFVQELRALANSLTDWSELGSSARGYSEKIYKLARIFDERGVRYEEPSETDCFKVLNHGDCWTNNMLFRYDNEGKVIDHIFVDFQMCWWTSPLHDIMNFLNTSLSEDVDAHNHETLVEEYHNSLTLTMDRIGCKTKPPTMEEFKKNFEKNQFFAIIPSCAMLATIIVDDNDVRSVNDTLHPNDDYVNPVYETPGFRKRIIRRLLAWNASGVLDV